MSKTKMLDILLDESARGVKEIAGSESNPRIMEYLDTTTIQATDDITPWCSACINWVAMEAGYTGTDSAASASWRRWGNPLKTPKRGCVIGFVRKDGSGHVGLYLSEDEHTYTILGGNQGDEIKVSRFKKGDRDWYFREPKTNKNSKSVWAGGVGGTVAAVSAVPYDSVLSTLKESKDRIAEVKYELQPIANEGWLDTINEYTPLIIIAMFGFLIWDRNRHMKKDGS